MTSWLDRRRLRKADTLHHRRAYSDLASHVATSAEELETVLSRLPASDRARVLAALHEPTREMTLDNLIAVPRCLVQVAHPQGVDRYAITWSAAAGFPTVSEATRAMHEQLDIDAFRRAVVRLRRHSKKAQDTLTELGCDVRRVELTDIDKSFAVVFTLLQGGHILQRINAPITYPPA